MASTNCAEWHSFPLCGYYSTSRQNHFKGPVAPLIATCEISKFLSLTLLGGDSIQKPTLHCRSLERQHLTGDQHWAWCSAANGRQCASRSDMSRGWRPFSTLHVQSSSSAWMHICVTLVLFHSLHILQNYRPKCDPGVVYKSPSI